MKSLILNDLYNISTIIKQLLFAVVILSITLLSSMGAGVYIIFCTCLCGVMIINLFAMDEKANWLKYALIMPITKSEYVYAKYIMAMLFIFSGMFLSVLFSAISGIAGLAKGMEAKDLVLYMFFGIGVGILFISLYIPVMVRYGTEKARFIMIGILMLPSIIGVVLSSGDGAPAWVMKGIENGANILKSKEYLIVVLIAAILGISVSLSSKWIQKKEF